jgi:tetratricopeptide (TPR) repeat protein
MSLNNLSTRLSGLGRREAALQAIEEAVSIRRTLSAARPDAFLPDLAGSLNNLSNCLSRLGRREAALQAIEEAVSIRRTLSADRPDAFLPNLARSLGTRGSILVDADPPAAAASFAQAIQSLRGMFAALPQAHAHLMGALTSDYVAACETAGIEADQALLAPVATIFQQITAEGDDAHG